LITAHVDALFVVSPWRCRYFLEVFVDALCV
jgi:hypothetical protein